ncbi:CehA/McbA family metallohydrolase [Cohnella sp. CBP 2801]|uniref:CehA/McbA family metallohydrolase n=2 Tax=Cohnella zeiphila TaxID=2761120 RepID=A0A7X0VX80_9BACL|nr:CehA/McbA family metallohydrolase [Cohnella zeiphila]
MRTNEPRRAEITFTRAVARGEQGGYLEIPFEMPDRVEELHVEYRVESPGEEKAVIDLGVRDATRIRGWSGGARTCFRIGTERATPGYMPGPLAPGRWAVVHNAYRVPEEGCVVSVTVRLSFRTPRWLRGDLHTHSVHSDGKFTLAENAAIMERLGCDFIAMTDHNAVSQNEAYPRETDLVMIPGMEFTTNYGHCNFLGVPDPLDDFRVANQADVDAKLAEARRKGAMLVLNHPLCEYCPWEWSLDAEFDAVEIWNGPFADRNARALAWWQRQLALGRRLVAVGGSDVHRPDRFVKHAMPCTWVLAETRTAAGILDGIAKGHVVISHAPDGPFIDLTCGSFRGGDVYPAERLREPIRLWLDGLHAGDVVKLIGAEGVASERTAAEDGELALEEEAAAAGSSGFVRAEVWRFFGEAGTMLPAAVSNPIYFE